MVIHELCDVTRCMVKVKEVQKLQKWLISESVSSASMYEIKRLTV